MIRLTLQQDIYTLIDDADQLLVSGFPWRPLQTDSEIIYAHAWNGRQHIYMHRLIMGAGPGEQVDHRNGNGLDNQQSNLRIASRNLNGANRGKQHNNTSGFKGVYWDRGRSRWMATIHVNGKSRSLGRYADAEAAARAYDSAAAEAWGRFARLNFPIETVTVCGLHDLGIPDVPCTC